MWEVRQSYSLLDIHRLTFLLVVSQPTAWKDVLRLLGGGTFVSVLTLLLFACCYFA